MNTENTEISKWNIMQAELEYLEAVLRYSWPSLSLEANKTTPGSNLACHAYTWTLKGSRVTQLHGLRKTVAAFLSYFQL